MTTGRDCFVASILVCVLLSAACYLMVSECLSSAGRATVSTPAVIGVSADRREPALSSSARRS